MIPVEFHLNFTRTQWVASRDNVRIVAGDLDELDSKIKDFLRDTYHTGSFVVKMYFDFDRFPTWMRQYMPHYFNRELTYQL
jgi:hypothetical protein